MPAPNAERLDEAERHLGIATEPDWPHLPALIACCPAEDCDWSWHESDARLDWTARGTAAFRDHVARTAVLTLV